MIKGSSIMAAGLSAVAVAVACAWLLWPATIDPAAQQAFDATSVPGSTNQGSPSVSAERGFVRGAGREAAGGTTVVQSTVTARTAAAGEAKGAVSKDPMDYGQFPPCDPTAHPQAASVAQALKDGTHPERLSPMVPTTPFDMDAYRKDPKPYLSVSEPGRVLVSRQPGDGVPAIRRVTGMYHNLRQGDKVAMSVQVGPGDPVSWATFDGGRFVENTLSAITVQADEKGVATATFEATSGVIANVSLLCSSPCTSGQLRFQMFVELPQGGLPAPMAARGP